MVMLPAGVEVYTLGGAAAPLVARGDESGPLDGFDDFIDDGQLARYFVGDRATSPERPSNATYKLGVVRPHSAFTPHAHGGEHFVLSLGYASCGVYDAARERPVRVPLTPGTMIRIPALLPHSFGNRDGRPLLILAANTGYGIDHADYAITAEEAERRALAVQDSAVDYVMLAKALHTLDGGPGRTSLRERLARVLRDAAHRLERR
ncbi:hypothetical protein Val02_13820 [Virgisporangium aliadipatigenens]|uniref:Cupin domain-containing protein n=1 Tax=Virgisporangium aliadipatigenens TaxID=741659 RepID=A0A8J3YID0_9ACTN|nr:cupin domain-containing protein [Virgisporangium aliadipatigenens]GIJ44496.1 hypothetical protein Val02_13820 [Virgisporangium aliadipatigenens]